MSHRGDCLVRYARLDDCLAGATLRARLHGDEARHYERINDASRRRQWLAGRALARELLCDTLQLDRQDELQIISRDDRGLVRTPILVMNGRRLDCSLSISHTSSGVLVALVRSGGVPVGVDLCDEAESFTPGFLRLWFTPEEQASIRVDRRRAATIWAIKEAVYKAASHGAPWNPREIEVRLAGELDLASAAGWQCHYRGQRVEPLTLAARSLDGQTAVIACLAHDVAVLWTAAPRTSRPPELQSQLQPKANQPALPRGGALKLSRNESSVTSDGFRRT